MFWYNHLERVKWLWWNYTLHFLRLGIQSVLSLRALILMTCRQTPANCNGLQVTCSSFVSIRWWIIWSVWTWSSLSVHFMIFLRKFPVFDVNWVPKKFTISLSDDVSGRDAAAHWLWTKTKSLSKESTMNQQCGPFTASKLIRDEVNRSGIRIREIETSWELIPRWLRKYDQDRDDSVFQTFLRCKTGHCLFHHHCNC